jgi:DUF4097 and DUF4098 domain-containing protein YvlB
MRMTLAMTAAGAVALAGCNADTGGGATVSRNYQVGNFHEIEVAGSYDVDVRTGAALSVSARGSEKRLDKTVVEVQGDKLVIHPQNDHSFFHFGFSGSGSAHFTVTVPQLTASTVAGSGSIKIDKVQGPSFEGTVAGSGDIDVASVEAQRLKLSTAGSGSLKARAGKAQSVEYAVSGSGDVDAAGVQAQEAKIEVAGSGGVKANALGNADVNIMGSGDVTVTGGAKCTVSKAGSGSAHCS